MRIGSWIEIISEGVTGEVVSRILAPVTEDGVTRWIVVLRVGNTYKEYIVDEENWVYARYEAV